MELWNKTRPFCVALILHLLLGAGIHFGVDGPSSRRGSDGLSIQLVETQLRPNLPFSAAGRAGRAARVGVPQPSSFSPRGEQAVRKDSKEWAKKLGVPLFADPGSAEASPQSPFSSHPTHGPSEGSGKEASWAGPVASESAQRTLSDPDFTLKKRIYEQINQSLTYPSELIERKETGVVFADLFFDSEGKWVRDQSQFESASSFLRVHVIQTLKRIFRTSMASGFQSERGQSRQRPLQIRARFVFEKLFHNEAPTAGRSGSGQPVGVVGPSLFFHRKFSDSILHVEAGPLHLLGPVPSVDLLWFLKKGAQAWSGKKPHDPLQKYREDPEW